MTLRSGIFVSAVSKELRTVRQLVPNTLQYLVAKRVQGPCHEVARAPQLRANGTDEDSREDRHRVCRVYPKPGGRQD